MQVQIEPIDHLPDLKNLVFAAVQLSQPALKEVEKTTRDKEKKLVFEWDVVEREKRIRDVRDILAALLVPLASRKPDVVVFSEYSLPPQAYVAGKGIPFQELADAHRCIIIAGSYFDDDPDSALFCNNLCPIYLPGRKEPIRICKAEPSEKERTKLLSSDRLKNVLRLVWHPAGAAPASINVFLCRDYLIPFEQRDAVRPAGLEATKEYVSLLDWEREGINIVVMNNLEPGPFEGQASLDIRMTHGKQKLVLFSNAANDENKLATALIGVSSDKARVRDIATQLPPASEGVLLVEAQLWEVMGVRRFPDTRVDYPVHHIERFKYEAGATPCLSEMRLPASFPLKRGIFHPALLGALLKYIVIELLVVQSSHKVEKLFKDNRIKHVTAGFVRGIEDVLIKKYVEQHTWVKHTIPGLAPPHAFLSDKDSREAFEIDDKRVPHSKFIIDPRNIIKFRGEEVVRQTDEEWDAMCQEFSRTIGTRRDALQQIISISTSLPPGATIDESYRRIFCLGEEDVVPLGKQYQNRETYVAIAVERSEISRVRDHIRNDLVKDKRIRDIYEVTDDDIKPESAHHKFAFLLRLKCNVFETDEVVEALQDWAADKLRIGTRSYDLWRYIARDSIAAIGDQTTEVELRFLNDLFEVDQSYTWVLSPEFRERFAHTLSGKVRDFGKIRTAEVFRLQDCLKQFFYGVCLYNTVDDAEAQLRCARDAKQAWLDLIGFVENAARTLLTKRLQMSHEAEASDISKAAISKLKLTEQKRETNLVRLFGTSYDALAEKPLSALSQRVRTNIEVVMPLRNHAAHENPNAWRKDITIKGERWEAEFDALVQKVEVLRILVADFAHELEQQQAP